MEVFNLNIIPGAVAPIIHASQYDEDREFRANLFEGDQVFELTGEETISVNVRKTDGNVVTAAVVNTGSNYVEFSTTEQMTACAGANLCQLRIENSPRKIGTLNFILAVERDPLEGGIQSESEINNLATQVAGMVAEEVATQYDSANVIFDNEPTENHGIGYTVTSEGIKTAIDNAFDYDNTASGSLVHIEDGADNIPVKSLTSEIVAVESGSGEKSPTNPYTISGFDSGIITRCGKNLFNNTFSDYLRPSDYRIFPIKLKQGATYNFSAKLIGTAQTGFTVGVAKKGDRYADFGSFYTICNGTDKMGSFTVDSTFTDPKLIVYANTESAFNAIFENYEIQLNEGNLLPYTQYNGNNYEFAFGQTVYGGNADIIRGSGAKTFNIVDNATIPIAKNSSSADDYLYYMSLSNNDRAEVEKYMCSHLPRVTSIPLGTQQGFIFYNDYNVLFFNMGVIPNNTMNGMRQYLIDNNVQFVYPLATPQAFTFEPVSIIKTFLGENNIFSNCGDVEVNYYTYKSNDILEFIDSEIGKKNGTNIPIEENSQDSIKDYVDNEVSTINTSLSNKASKTEDTTITLASGYSLISSSCGKTDRLVHLNFNVEKSGGFATGWQVIGTTEFKPNTLAYCPLWNVTNGVGNGEVRIDTDGTINFYIVTAGELRLNANIGYITE